jgi:hypothetical protein
MNSKNYYCIQLSKHIKNFQSICPQRTDIVRDRSEPLMSLKPFGVQTQCKKVATHYFQHCIIHPHL